MKKKGILFLAGLIGISGTAFSQAQNPECMTNLSVFGEHAKVKNYDAAYEPWKMVFDNCPELHPATYVYGERILKDKIGKSEGAEQEELVNTLMSMYDKELEYFPKRYSKANVLAKKALLMYDQKTAEGSEIFAVLDDAFQNDRANFSNPKALYLYFSLMVDEYDAGNKDLQQVFDTYDAVNERIDEEMADLSKVLDEYVAKEEAGETLDAKSKQSFSNAKINTESYGKISSSIDAKLGDLADCENLIPLLEKNFEAKKNDAQWLRRSAGRMDGKDCSDDPMFIKLVEALHQVEPSSRSAYYLGVLNDKKGNSAEALKYYNESVSLETDTYKKANTLFKIGVKYKNAGQKTTAYKYFKQVLDVQPSNGKAYLQIAALYAGSANECGATPFEKRAVYWKAAQMARKAGQVDPSVKSHAAQTAASYEGRAPGKQDIFSSGMAGKTIQFNCWIGGSITVPNI
ncbi:hypothetical protein DN748_06380 [Sinomicrobium soli]|nr:hypothetical protein DN748_06380 [Sinomicrobium sp. N-1-3-6]